MTQIKHYGVNVLPNTAETGAIYLTNSGDMYVGTSANTFKEFTSTLFVDTLPEFGTPNKLYIHTVDSKAKLKVWNGLDFELLSGKEYDATQLEFDIAQLQSDLANLQGKVDTAESKITTNTDKISTLEIKVADLENKEVDATLIQTQIDIAKNDINTVEDTLSTHQSKSVLDENGAHNFKVADDILFVFENDEWRQIEVIASVLPQARAFKSTVNIDDTITISWTNPTNTEFLRTQLYVSTTDISGLDIDDMDGMVDVQLVSNGTSESYIHNGTYGVTYYFKLFTIHELFGSEKVATPSIITGKIVDTTPPSVVTNVKIISGDGTLTVSWTNPADQDLGNVRLNYDRSNISSINEGIMVFNGTGTSVTIEGLENGVEYVLRFFTIDNNGNINDSGDMIYFGKPRSTIQPPFGVKIDTTNSNPETAVTYIENSTDFVPAKMNFTTDTFDYGSWEDKFPFNQIKPCVLKNGVVNYYLNPNDYTKKIDGSPADITSGNDGDVMVEFPKIYWKFERIGTNLYIRYSDTKVDSGYKCLAHMRDTEEKDKVYISAYLGKEISGKLRSLSGQTPTANKNIGAFRNIARANGAQHEQMAYYQLLMLQVLYLIMFKDRDSQVALGRGFVDGNTTTTVTGGTNQEGLFYGDNTGKKQIKFCGVEDFYGNLLYFIDGFFSDANRNILIGTQSYNDSASGYVNHGQGSTSNLAGYVSDVQGSTETGFIIKESIGSVTTHWSDNGYLTDSCVPLFGGSWSSASAAGAFQFYAAIGTTVTAINYGSRLLFL